MEYLFLDQNRMSSDPINITSPDSNGNLEIQATILDLGRDINGAFSDATLDPTNLPEHSIDSHFTSLHRN